MVGVLGMLVGAVVGGTTAGDSVGVGIGADVGVITDSIKRVGVDSATPDSVANREGAVES